MVFVAPYELGHYKVTKSLNISIECLAEDEFVATFDEAELAIAEDTIVEAVNAIKRELVEVYKLYTSGEKLGPRPKRQLAALEKYVVKRR
ncbi:MAG: hypothetical protein ACSLE5_12055 [Porticoccaceae bacterium]